MQRFEVGEEGGDAALQEGPHVRIRRLLKVRPGLFVEARYK